MIKYKLLFRIRLGHAYYTDGANRDFAVKPTPETESLLKRHGLRFHPTPEGGEVWYRSDAAGIPLRPLANIPPTARFDFGMHALNSDWVAYTSLVVPPNPMPELREVTMYFDTDNGAITTVSGDVVEVNLLPGLAGPTDDLDVDSGAGASGNFWHNLPTFLPTLDVLISLEQAYALAGVPNGLEAVDKNGTVVATTDDPNAGFSFEGGIVRAQLDMRPHPPGYYQLRFTTVAHGVQNYLAGWVSTDYRRSGRCGVISIQKSADWEDIPSNDTPITYTIEFTTARRIWRIFVVKKSTGSLPACTLEDMEIPATSRYGEMAFRDDGATTVNGYPARLFLTSKPADPSVPHAMRYFQEAKDLLELNVTGDPAVKAIPMPPLHSLSANGTTLYRDLYLYI